MWALIRSHGFIVHLMFSTAGEEVTAKLPVEPAHQINEDRRRQAVPRAEELLHVRQLPHRPILHHHLHQILLEAPARRLHPFVFSVRHACRRRLLLQPLLLLHLGPLQRLEKEANKGLHRGGWGAGRAFCMAGWGAWSRRKPRVASYGDGVQCKEEKGMVALPFHSLVLFEGRSYGWHACVGSFVIVFMQCWSGAHLG